MKLSTLVQIKNFLLEHNDSSLLNDMNNLISQCELYLSEAEYNRFCDVFVYLKDDYRQIASIVDQARARRQKVLDEIEVRIDTLGQQYLERDPEIYNDHKRRTVEFNRQYNLLGLNDDVDQLVRARIGRSVSWQYPGLEIGPGDGEFTKRLVACDPLYLVDVHQEFLDSTMSQFNQAYQRRLRPYLVKETDLSVLPQNQFGFVLAWNVFNYLPLGMIEQYLINIYGVLRPGGTVMFSYNNSEKFVRSARWTETGHMSYAPRKLVVPKAEKIGYTVSGEFDFWPEVSWLELTKPGQLSTVKAHPVLGRIVGK